MNISVLALRGAMTEHIRMQSVLNTKTVTFHPEPTDNLRFRRYSLDLATGDALAKGNY